MLAKYKESDTLKESGIKKRTKYIQLDELESDQQSVNFYAVVIDATYPFCANDNYVTVLKVIDKTINSVDDELVFEEEAEPKHSMVVVYAKRIEDSPILRRIGDVVRVNKASPKIHRGQQQFIVKTFHDASWALFSTNPAEDLGVGENNSG